MFAALIVAVLMAHYFGLAWWAPAAIYLVIWLAVLPVLAWRDYLAAMNWWRVEKGGRQVLLNTGTFNTPDAQYIGRRVIGPGAMLHDFFLNVIWASLYFWDWPREVTVTKRLNRLASGPVGDWRTQKAKNFQFRWLDRYDPRGEHR